MAFSPRLLFYAFCCAASLLFAFASYMLLLSSVPIVTLATFLPHISAGAFMYRNCCRSWQVDDDRGSQLFHSWSDAELFHRALSAEAKLSSEGREDGSQESSGFQSLGWLRSSLFPVAGGADPGYANRSSISASNNVNHQSNLSSSASSALSPQQVPSCHGRHAHLHLPFLKSKIAFLFLTRGPLPFLPLWNQFFHGHQHLYNIYVHLDPFRIGVFDHKTAGVFWGRLIPPDFTERGTPSLAAAERRLLANALLDDPLNHYFALVSERCIPLVSFKQVYDHVRASDKSFLEILTDTPMLSRRYAARGTAEMMLPEVPFESFRAGSQFFILTRKHAVLVVADERIWSKFKMPCVRKQDCYVEEHYFPTLIDMEDATCSTHSTLTNVDWSHSPGNGHPRIYNRSEVGQALIASLRMNGTFLFARKFGDDCLEPLLGLSSFILGKEGPKM